MRITKWMLAHFGVSLAAVSAVVSVAALVWYPGPSIWLSGGIQLLLVLGMVDVALGPLCSYLVLRRPRPRRELMIDVTVILALQAAALAYGAFTAFQARPVALAFEYRLFRIVHANEMDAVSSLPQSEASFFGLPVYALRPFEGPDEQFTATMRALSGEHLATQRALWAPYESQKDDVLRAAQEYIPPQDMQPADVLRTPVVYLPVLSRDRSAVLVLSRDQLEPQAVLRQEAYANPSR